MFPSFNPILGTGIETTSTAPTLRRDSSTGSVSGGLKCGWLLQKFFDGLVPVTRLWGVMTAIVLAGVGVELSFHRHRIGYYLLGCSTFVLIAEVTWVATLFLQICVRNDHKLWKYWKGVTWFSVWKKTLIYAPMSVLPLIWPHKLWLSYVASGQLLSLALFHLILSFQSKKKKRRRKDHLLHTDGDSFESSKFEEITECLDDCLPEPIPGSSHSISDSLVEQDTILEI
ncbi:uncharacterized protein LOC130892035 [Diorhabda carinulata]|uniref:uncharacterized protein LOC130892035 n=1 Tax=Diorhabda carinulata TaxID=1163345 RepID=UPI0025A12663|nr:uncharacterized protein LOC130892035 [Diorhabda carinulata]